MLTTIFMTLIMGPLEFERIGRSIFKGEKMSEEAATPDTGYYADGATEAPEVEVPVEENADDASAEPASDEFGSDKSDN